jgi:hypothetical protein
MDRPARLPALLVLALAVVACANPPDAEMSEARKAIEAARAAGAEQYAAGQYDEAVTALRRSEEAVVQRDYRQALAFALDSRERARSAAQAAVEQKGVARAEAERSVRQLEGVIGSARAEADKAEAEHPSRAAQRHASDIRRAIVVANVALQKAREALTRGDYGGVHQAVAGVADHVNAVVTENPAPPAPRTAARPRR